MAAAAPTAAVTQDDGAARCTGVSTGQLCVHGKAIRRKIVHGKRWTRTPGSNLVAQGESDFPVFDPAGPDLRVR